MFHLTPSEWETLYMLGMLFILFPCMPAFFIWMSIRDSRKFVASYPPEHQALAKQASDEMWPRGVLDNIIALREKSNECS